MKAYFALLLALVVVASVFAAEPEAKKDLKGAEQVYYASPYGGLSGYAYPGYPVAYPSAAYGYYWR